MSSEHSCIGGPVDYHLGFVRLDDIRHTLCGVEVSHAHGFLQGLLDALVHLHMHLRDEDKRKEGGREREAVTYIINSGLVSIHVTGC